MANFSVSNLVKAQAILNDYQQSPEMRESKAPVLELGRRNSEIMIPSHKILRTREDRPTDAYILTRNKRTTAGGTRMFDHTGSQGDSMAVPITFSTFLDKFSISIKLMDNNVFNFNEMLANQFRQAFANIRADIETYLTNYLFSERTAVNTATKNGVWNASNQAFEVTQVDDGRFWQMAKSMMLQNQYSGMYDVIADPVSYANAEYYAAQGSSNATNFGFQFNGMNFAQSNELDDPNYNNGVSLFLPANTFGVLDWIPRQNREGFGDYNDYVGGYGTMTDPVSGLTMAVHGYRQRADRSAMNGDTQDVVQEWEISVDLSPNLAPLSNANETVVFEVAA